MPSNNERMSRLSSMQGVFRLSQKDFKSNSNELIGTTLKALQRIWDEAGYDNVECNMLLGDIYNKFKLLCEQEITAENQILEHAKLQVQEKIKTLEELNRQLGRDEPIIEISFGGNTADILNNLEKSVDKVANEVAERVKILDKERNAIEILCRSLGESFPEQNDFDGPVGTPIMSDVRLNLMRQYRSTLETIKEKRIEDMKILSRDCQKQLNDLLVSDEGTAAIADSSKYEKIDAAVTVFTQTGEIIFDVHKDTFELLKMRVKGLIAEKEHRRSELASIGSEIARLWTLLHTPSSEREAFQSSFQMNLSMRTLQRGREELKRLLEIRKQSLGTMIAALRQDIMAMWLEAGISSENEQRGEFQLYFESIDKLQDSSIEEHEDYCIKLKARLEELRPTLVKIIRREAIILERLDLERLMLNPSRLQARGPKAREDRKAEEEMQRRVGKLPSINKELLAHLATWESQYGAFMYSGERYVDRMARQDEEFVEQREEIRREARQRKDSKGGAETLPAAPVPLKKKGSSNNGTTPLAGHLPPKYKDLSAMGATEQLSQQDQENSFIENDCISTLSDETGFTEMTEKTEIKDRASTKTIVRMIL